jgi:ABC-2 type transport system permease protein
VTARKGVIAGGVLRDQRRSLIGWMLSVAAVATMYSSFYPAIGAAKFEVMLDAMPEFTRAMGFDAMISAAGYVNATVFSLLGAILVLTCAIGAGARMIAGDEEAGVLELDLAAPVSRTRIYRERLAVLWLTVVLLVLSITAVLLVLSAVLELELAIANVAAAGISLVVFTGTLGTLAFGVGAATGHRAYGLGAASGVAVLAYLFSYIGPLINASWMETVSPFSWYIANKPIMNGFDWGGLALLAALAVVAAVGGLWRFLRRDLSV